MRASGSREIKEENPIFIPCPLTGKDILLTACLSRQIDLKAALLIKEETENKYTPQEFYRNQKCQSCPSGSIHFVGDGFEFRIKNVLGRLRTEHQLEVS